MIVIKDVSYISAKAQCDFIMSLFVFNYDDFEDCWCFCRYLIYDFGVINKDFSYFSRCDLLVLLLWYVKITGEGGGCVDSVGIRGSYGVQKTFRKLICEFVNFICLVLV